MPQDYKLIIGFDAKRAFLNSTGLGNYSRSVITSLAKNFPDNEFHLYTPSAPRVMLNAAIWDYANILIHKPKLSFLKSIWRSRLVVRQLLMDNIQLYHGLSHEIPIGIQRTNIKTVVTIHDLIFLRYPQYYTAIDRNIYTIKFKNACNNADLILATSEQTKRDIITYFEIDASKIEVVYQSCNPLFYQPVRTLLADEVKAKYLLPEHYILNVGTIEERKNLVTLIKALSSIPDKYKLVVVGKPTAYFDKVQESIAQLQLGDRVVFLQDVSNEELPVIYRNATVFVCPSVFEGFGIPIVEALHAEVPVVAASGSCLEEAGGNNSLYFSPYDSIDLAKQVNRILQDKALSNEMSVAGKAYAQQFTEDVHAQRLMEIYKGLLST